MSDIYLHIYIKYMYVLHMYLIPVKTVIMYGKAGEEPSVNTLPVLLAFKMIKNVCVT